MEGGRDGKERRRRESERDGKEERNAQT